MIQRLGRTRLAMLGAMLVVNGALAIVPITRALAQDDGGGGTILAQHCKWTIFGNGDCGETCGTRSGDCGTDTCDPSGGQGCP